MTMVSQLLRIIKNLLLKCYETYYIRRYRFLNQRNLKRIRCKTNPINVLFLPMNLSMWKYDGLYRLLQKNDRFNPVIVLSPRLNQPDDNIRSDIQQMEEYFAFRNYQYVKGYDRKDGDPYDIKILSPDIIFYTQPQMDKVGIRKEYSFINHPFSLVCHVPYDYKISAEDYSYDLLLHNIAWKLFYPNPDHKLDAQKLARNEGSNVFVTGYPIVDELHHPRPLHNPWRHNSKKRIIWAPHHSINHDDLLDYSTFLDISELMVELSIKHKDTCEFAFKPHPVLKSKLYEKKDWGREKTDRYYHYWETSDNTSLSEGYYIDLFLHSDAMLHDCSSFTVEYLCTLKPVMYLNNHMHDLTDFGRKAYDCHYKPACPEDIEKFIVDVVLNDKDEIKNKRKEFAKKYLLPASSKTAAENIYDHLTAL